MEEQTGGLLPLKPHHVGILVRDLEASIKWYHDILGFTVVARDWLDWLVPPFRHRIALLTNGAFCIELFGFKNEQTISATHRNIAPGVDDTPGMKTLAFYAPDDWEKFTEMLERKEVVITERGQKGNARIIRDNSGNAIEFLTQEGLDKAVQRGTKGLNH